MEQEELKEIEHIIYLIALKRRHGDIVLSYSGEYRIYIVKLLEGIEDKYKPNVVSELINPQVKKITGIELLEIIQPSQVNNIEGVNYGKNN